MNLKSINNWKFNVTGKNLVERDGKEMLYVNMWAYRGHWEQVNHVWFYLNENGEIKDLEIYPYIKTTHPAGVSPEEREEMLSLAMNDSEVRDAIAGREYNIWQMIKYVNPFTGEEKSRQIYIKINNSPLTYIINIKGSNVSIENTTCPSGEGFCFGVNPTISIEELPTPEGYHG